MYDTTVYNTTPTVAAGTLGAVLGIYMVVVFIVGVAEIIAMWKIFTKAGKPGWASIIPFYNVYTLFEVAGMDGWMFLLLCIPFVNIVFGIKVYLDLAKAFGKSTGFAIGLILLNPIFILILGLGNAEYQLKQQ